MSDQTELDLLKKAERALVRLNPPLLISGPLTGETDDSHIGAVCAVGAFAAARKSRRKMAVKTLIANARTWWSGDFDAPNGYIIANDYYRQGDNDEATCRERHAYMLSWVRTRIREEQRATA